jgi:hypothetical protein
MKIFKGHGKKRSVKVMGKNRSLKVMGKRKKFPGSNPVASTLSNED